MNNKSNLNYFLKTRNVYDQAKNKIIFELRDGFMCFSCKTNRHTILHINSETNQFEFICSKCNRKWD